MITEIGKHKVRHGDVMHLSVPNALMQNDQCQLFYSDPPWGTGNLSYWQTMNAKMNEGAERKSVDLNAFLAQIFNLAKAYTKPDGLIFIEYGVKWEKEILDRAASYGFIHLGTAHPLYRSGSKLLPLHLHVFSKTQINLPNGYLESIRDTYGMDTLRNAVRPFVKQGEVIFDPCCGMGYCAQIAIENNMAFRGNELNHKRLSKTIDRLKRNEVSLSTK